MSINDLNRNSTVDEVDRSWFQAGLRGLRGKCPSCGENKLFDRGLQVHAICGSCGQEMHHHRADDLPAYLNIFIIGHIVVAAAMILMDYEVFGMWTLVIISSFLALFLAIMLLRPLKGMVIGIQWAMKMHGFGGHDD